MCPQSKKNKIARKTAAKKISLLTVFKMNVRYFNFSILRSQLLTDLRHYMTSVGSQVEEVANLQSSYQEKHSTVEQRMKWAVGANPDGLEDRLGLREQQHAAAVVAKRRTNTAQRGPSLACHTPLVCHHAPQIV